MDCCGSRNHPRLSITTVYLTERIAPGRRGLKTRSLRRGDFNRWICPSDTCGCSIGRRASIRVACQCSQRMLPSCQAVASASDDGRGFMPRALRIGDGDVRIAHGDHFETIRAPTAGQPAKTSAFWRFQHRIAAGTDPIGTLPPASSRPTAASGPARNTPPSPPQKTLAGPRRGCDNPRTPKPEPRHVQ